jgi:hypothetical protein
VYGLLPSIPLDDIHVALLLASIPTLLVPLFRLARVKRKTNNWIYNGRWEKRTESCGFRLKEEEKKWAVCRRSSKAMARWGSRAVATEQQQRLQKPSLSFPRISAPWSLRLPGMSCSSRSCYQRFIYLNLHFLYPLFLGSLTFIKPSVDFWPCSPRQGYCVKIHYRVK